jgi:hypothetical protein
MANRPTSWRDFDGEDEMTEADWMARGGEQARAMLNALDPFDSSPDQDGTPTGGCYNGDYPDSYHAQLNERLDHDEYFEAEVSEDVQALFSADSLRRADQASD